MSTDPIDTATQGDTPSVVPRPDADPWAKTLFLEPHGSSVGGAAATTAELDEPRAPPPEASSSGRSEIDGDEGARTHIGFSAEALLRSLAMIDSIGSGSALPDREQLEQHATRDTPRSVSDTATNPPRYGFKTGRLRLLTPANGICEVQVRTSLCAVPNSVPWLAGMANLRGQLIPVFDLQALCRAENGAGSTAGNAQVPFLLVFDRAERAYAVLSDQLPEPVFEPRAETRNPTVLDADLPPAMARHVRETLLSNDQAWLDLDLAGLLQTLMDGNTASLPE
ncbi:MAG: chemotaxis protein CheW [Gammaproteobacteria bacterium]|nr:chemotaxis protein CheW [Gammaproteobacteria bacterium]